MAEWQTETWLDQSEIAQIEYADYWNDEVAEQDKEWNVEDGDFERMEAYLERSGLAPDLAYALTALADRGLRVRGRGIDLAAGTLWAAPRLLAAGGEHVTCVEFSAHRLLKLGPKVLEHAGVGQQQVMLALGSFYELGVSAASLDFAFMGQALHHADDPGALLRETARVLKPGGVLIVIGEHIVPLTRSAFALARAAVARTVPPGIQRRVLGRELEPWPSALAFPPDPVLGDHYYTRRHYKAMFAGAGFDATRIRRPGAGMQSFLAVRR